MVAENECPDDNASAPVFVLEGLSRGETELVVSVGNLRLDQRIVVE